MGWTVKYLKSSRKDIKNLDPQARERIKQFLEKRVTNLGHPRQLGKPLKGNLANFWRYQIGSYRIICELRDNELIVLVVRVGHRKEIYKEE